MLGRKSVNIPVMSLWLLTLSLLSDMHCPHKNRAIGEFHLYVLQQPAS